MPGGSGGGGGGGGSTGPQLAGRWGARTGVNPFARPNLTIDTGAGRSDEAPGIAENDHDSDDDRGAGPSETPRTLPLGKENRSPKHALSGRKGGAAWTLPTVSVVDKQRFQHITVSRGSRWTIPGQDKASDEDEESKDDAAGDLYVTADVSVLGKRSLGQSDDSGGFIPSKAHRQDMGNVSCTSVADARLAVDPLDDDDDDDHTRAVQEVTMSVNDFTTVPVMSFGKVAAGSRRSLRLTLTNPSELGNARVKYEGYALTQPIGGAANGPGSSRKKAHPRFKCDLHMCVVDAQQSMVLRISFEPNQCDAGHVVNAELRFTVNDKFKLRCKATGTAGPRASKRSRFGRRRRSGGALTPIAELVVAENREPTTHSTLAIEQDHPDEDAQPATSVSFTIPLARSQAPEPTSDSRSAVNSAAKRRGSLMLEFSPTRRRPAKRRRSSTVRFAANDSDLLVIPHEVTSGAKAPASSLARSTAKGDSKAKPYAGSWWKQRQEFYDENWMSKQEEGFTKWINYVLIDSTNQRMTDETESSGDTGDDFSASRLLSDNAKSRLARRRFNFSSLRVLAQKRMEIKWSRAAVEIYHSPGMDDILFDLQEEISCKKLLCRSDRPVYADVGLQQELICLLNNYHPVWLCLGLEAVLGHQVLKHERCSLRAVFSATTARKSTRKKESTKMPLVLRQIILNHLIKDSNIAKKFRLVKNLKTPIDGSINGHDGGNGFMSKKKRINGREYYDSLMETFILKFLMLILFLDRAIDHRADKFVHFPCLFRIGNDKAEDPQDHFKEAAATNVKKSQLMVTEFCRFFLAAEGRIDRHLKQLGYEVQHEQTPLDELNLEVKKLAVDLRDGVRLAKLMEVLTATPSPAEEQRDEATNPPDRKLSSFLRVPALSRLQKVHNVEICLNYLQEKCGTSILEDVKSKRGTMIRSSATSAKKLKGRVRISSSGFASLRSKVDEKLLEQLAKDIVDGHREKTLALLWRLISCFQLQSLVDIDAIGVEIERVLGRMSFRAREFFDKQQHAAPLSFPNEDQVYSLLLQWCRAVCANYMVEIHDFTTSFADGRVLCYLMHYYHPMLLSKADIAPTLGDPAENRSEVELLANESRHFAMVNARVKQLGEIPVMMPQYYHSKNPPEEKMVVTFVCYLQSRLMESSKEIHAASRLKRWWLSPLIRLKMRRKKNKSARIIQRFWYTSSTKRLAIRQCRKLLRAADQVKSIVRASWERKQYMKMRKGVVAIQRAFRRKHSFVERKNMVVYSAAAAKIQRVWVKHVEHKTEVERQARQAVQRRIEHRKVMKASCLKIEEVWWNYLSREYARRWRRDVIKRRQLAAVQIQLSWKRHVYRQILRQGRRELWAKLHANAAIIQRGWRRCLTRWGRQQHLTEMHCATKIQSAYRCHIQRKQFVQEQASAKVLQRNVRVWRRRKQFKALSRFYDVLVKYEAKKEETQREREVQIRKLKTRTLVRATSKIQGVYRAFADRQVRVAAAVKIQSATRGYLYRCWYQTMRSSAVVLQRNVRVWRRMRQYQALQYFYSMLQCYQRMVDEQERRRTHQLLRLRRKVEFRAAFRIQNDFRQYIARKRNIAAIRIQAAFRGFVVRRKFAAVRAASVKIQKTVRGWLVRSRRFDYFALRFQLRYLRVLMACWRIESWYTRRLTRHRRRRSLLVRARWTQLRAGLLEKRRAQVDAISSCWRSYRLRRAIAARIQNTRRIKWQQARKTAAWTISSCWSAFRLRCAIAARVEKTRRVKWQQMRNMAASIISWHWSSFRLRCEIAARIEHKREVRRLHELAATKLQQWWVRLWWKWHTRHQLAEARRRRQALDALRQKVVRRAGRTVAQCVLERVIIPQRQAKVISGAGKKLQSWWRGSLVRMHVANPKVTMHRKKLAKMPLVIEGPAINMREQKRQRESVSGGALRVPVPLGHPPRPQPPAQPLTLGGRLDMALHMLMHGKRLQEMLFASHTIEVCTRYSRECCFKCVELRIANTIFAAIRGLNRSRPHVELLHQLLGVLVNLTAFQEQSTASKRALARNPVDEDIVKDEVRAVETIVDLLHIHRDMHHVFVPSARVLRHYLMSVRARMAAMAPTHEARDAAENAWSDADRRLRSLQRLLESKAALYAATAATRALMLQVQGQSASSEAAAGAGGTLMSKMDPRKALSIMNQLLEQFD